MRAEDVYKARRLVQQSLAIDANYARSYVVLSNTRAAVFGNRLDSVSLNSGALDLAHQYARKAVELDPNLPDAHAVLGFVLVWKRQHDASIAGFERAVALNSNHVDWRFGWALVMAGESQRAIDVLRAYMRLDPFHASLASCFVGAAYFMLEKYPEALGLLRDYVSRVPQAGFGHTWLAATYAQVGQLEEARAEVTEVLRLRPGYIIGAARCLAPFKHAKDDKHYFDALRRAGLPE